MRLSEECWHWSYAPIAQVLLEALKNPDVLLRAHKRLCSYWDEEHAKKSSIGFDYPRIAWPDHAFHVHAYGDDFLYSYGAGELNDDYYFALPPI